MLPCGCPPTIKNVTDRTLSPPVSPTPALSRSCLDPLTTMGSLSARSTARFHPPEDEPPLTALRASRSPWVRTARTAPSCQLHPLRSLDPPASPFAPTRVAPSRRPILSWASASLELSPSTPWILRPAQTRGPEHAPVGRSLRDTTRGTSRPPAPGETAPNTRMPWESLVGGIPTPFGTGPRRLSTALLLPWPWVDRASPTVPDLRSLAVRGERRVSEEIACSSEVSCLLAVLVTLEPPRSGLIASPRGRASVSGHPSTLWT